ncbi:hypothetical protein [Nostoc sp. ChiSLP03a]|uniref:hypothetical protein n=1 Tax=Nostoc sp. ChiSLP03a TaxID=3075380 RepID=UPI002AD47FFD|nr:hypothetical protein [Nostoc sp. ChiSLP03a]MDZ8209572.1 hypothetical protein [Nostoc sp. ChiSLP03a]
MTKSQINDKLLEQILHDSFLIEQLSDRVYKLLREDLRKHQERSQGYGSRI